MSAENIYKFMSPPRAPRPPEKPSAVAQRALKRYIAIKDGMAALECVEARQAAREEMRDLRGAIAEYLSIPFRIVR